MEMMGPSGDLVLSLHEMNDSGQSGIAVLTANGNQTEVVLYATADISEMNHIHSGSCMDLGGVSYPLTSIVNGISVTTVDASLDTLTSGDLAINLHKAGDPGTYTACIEIPVKNMMGAAQTLEVIIASFTLPDLNVTLGTTVTWTNQDGAPHTTTSGQNGQFDGAGWNSDQLLMGQFFTYTFDQVGTFAYTCRIHPSMNGTVTVIDETTY